MLILSRSKIGCACRRPPDRHFHTSATSHTDTRTCHGTAFRSPQSAAVQDSSLRMVTSLVTSHPRSARPAARP